MRTLAGADQLQALTDQLAVAIERQMQAEGEATPGWALIGVRSRGDELARRIAERIGPDRFNHRVGSLDITLYRDDLSEIGPQAFVRTTDVPFAIDGLNLVLVDDVLMSGRSVRAALTSLVDLGRPRRVWLAVLVDRGGRELPIAADFVALDLTRPQEVTLQSNDSIDVQLTPADEQDAIVVQ
jgi:pyrimidine operon attenuation protein/uracil phosphoribosyltransferase